MFTRCLPNFHRKRCLCCAVVLSLLMVVLTARYGRPPLIWRRTIRLMLPANQQTPAAPANPNDLDKLLDMADKDVSQLSTVSVSKQAPALSMEVSTVSRQQGTVGKSPAAVFVITNEMIRRSGALSIPEVLRMAPGVEVARLDSSRYAISIRGFNSRFSNKLLVQIDGRSVYTPLFGGVFWDAQDVVLEDVERIEVIRGPGRHGLGRQCGEWHHQYHHEEGERDPRGLCPSRCGTYEHGFTTGRVGGKIGEDTSYRVYGKWFDRGPGGAHARRPARLERRYFRARSRRLSHGLTVSEQDPMTFQADCYAAWRALSMPAQV